MTIEIKIKQNIRFLRNILKTYLFYLSKKFQRLSKDGDKDQPIVIFDIHSRYSERQFAYLIFCFNELDYKIFLKNNIHFFGNLNTYLKSIFSLDNVYLTNRTSADKKCALYITDNPIKSVDDSCEKLLILDPVIFDDQYKLRPSSEFMSFYMIPRLYYDNIHRRAERLRNNRRNIRLFFSGNVDPARYNSLKFKELFGQLTRIEILETIKTELDAGLINPLDKYDEQKNNQIIISEWVRKSMSQKGIQGRVENEDWLNTLSRVEFFIACPGYIQPLCHNVIEAMSVGAIPIIEHPGLFNPALENNVNAIIFNGKEELIQKINDVLKMSKDEIHTLRQNVIRYYTEILDPKSYGKLIVNNSAPVTTKYYADSSYLENLT